MRSCVPDQCRPRIRKNLHSESESPAAESPSGRRNSCCPQAAPKAGGGDNQQMVTDLKIKLANVNKTLLDLEMQNITGDLSDDEFKSKTDRLNQLKQKMEQQINDLS